MSKVLPARQEHEEEMKEEEEEQRLDEARERKGKSGRIYAMLLHDFLQKFGGHRFPKIQSHETYMKEGILTEFAFIPRGARIIYVSHEWVGTDHSDPRGNQFKHLVQLLERLRRGEIERTDMAALHSLLYKYNHTTTAEDWKRMLDPQNTYIFYDGFCVPREDREKAFRMIPEYIKRCDFMIILAPGCT